MPRLPPMICKQCGNVFQPDRSKRVVCGRPCGRLYKAAQCRALSGTLNPGYKHGASGTRSEHKIWKGITQRCLNPKNPNYGNYGGRGITIAPEWRGENGFETFLTYVGSRPSPNHSIDRYPNNDGNYEPGNVRWATRTQQARNTRTNRMLTVNGKTQCLKEWSLEVGLPTDVLQNRVNYGWSDEDVVLTPIRKGWGTPRTRKTSAPGATG